jgi:DNA-directed RNA polymerase II subunit RPB2
MTLGQFIEAITCKVSALEGHETDGTPFNDIDIDQMKDRLEKFGKDRNGYEYLYNGMTGRKIKSKIFICPTYYERLKHMVSDKLHSRSRGPRTLLTRQPPEGRSRDGGLRFGEMERDSIISHGLSRFLKERHMETSDAYETYVCATCGLFAQRMMRKDNKPYATQADIYFCPGCKNQTDVHKIRIPYAFKLLLQEMMSMNIAPRIRIKRNKFSE